MSQHLATIRWKRTTTDFDYDTYNRGHRWSFDCGLEIAASSAPDFKGDTDRIDPEEAYVASLASCHMLTFLAIAAKKRLVVDEYRDEAVGVLEKNSQNRLAITCVTLHPQVTFGGTTAVSSEELTRLHEVAHEQCFIANSVRTRILVEPP